MSDQEQGKKMEEKEYLQLFLEAYNDATGEDLEYVEPSERPDFLCQQSNGDVVGVELVKVMRDPESATCDYIVDKQIFRDAEDAYDAIWHTAEAKSKKLKNGDWQYRDNTILVLQVMDCPLHELSRYLEGFSSDEYADLGFFEVWVADYSEVDAYHKIELFGLYPKQRWRHYKRWRGKPYG